MLISADWSRILVKLKLLLAIVTNYMPDTFSFCNNFPIALVYNHHTAQKWCINKHQAALWLFLMQWHTPNTPRCQQNLSSKIWKNSRFHVFVLVWSCLRLGLIMSSCRFHVFAWFHVFESVSCLRVVSCQSVLCLRVVSCLDVGFIVWFHVFVLLSDLVTA